MAHLEMDLAEVRQGMEKKEHQSIYYKGLIAGLLLGIVGNLLVSILMRALDIFETWETWAFATIG